MRITEAARYARWAAGAAITLAAVVAVVYGYRYWQGAQVKKKAPPAVPPTVQQRSAEFSFSKVEKDRKLFTVRASRATEFKEGGKNLLEDVWITIYGRTGQRFDNIHTRACEYIPHTGRIVCSGEVQMDLESAEEARQRPGERVIHVGTSNVSFDRETGEATTDQPVQFRFPDGQGRAVGVSYSSREGVVRLRREVEILLAHSHAPRVSARARVSEPVTLTGGSLEYRRDTRVLRLLAPVRARQGHRELVAGELALEFDASLRARRFVARPRPDGIGAGGQPRFHRGQPELRSAELRGQALLAADEFVAIISPEGWTERILATGNVRGSMIGATGEDRLAAESLALEMLPARNQPHVLAASGEVTAQSAHRGELRRLETSALRIFFAPATKPGARRLERAESLAPATIEWAVSGTAGGNAAQQSIRLRGQQLAVEFDDRNRPRTLTGRDGVETHRRLPGRPPQVTTSRELVAKFAPEGGWTGLEQRGQVRFREAGRTAEADRAHLERVSDLVTLTGSVVLADAVARTTAQTASFNQRTGEIRAEGDVRSSDLAVGRGSATNLASQPAHISSDRLLANSVTGHVVYSGHARLWQGDAVIEADSVQLARDARRLDARGNVLAVFPQAPGVSSSSPDGSRPSGRAEGAGPDLWRVRASALSYLSTEARAHLEENVTAQSRQGQLSARSLDLYFSSAGPPAGTPAPKLRGGAQQLTRAVALGGVTVRQGERRGTADRADYTAAEGKFVLSGGRPTLYDASRGTTTGRQLTFFFADDRIIVDSEEGSRTLTRHPVEK